MEVAWESVSLEVPHTHGKCFMIIFKTVSHTALDDYKRRWNSGRWPSRSTFHPSPPCPVLQGPTNENHVKGFPCAVALAESARGQRRQDLEGESNVGSAFIPLAPLKVPELAVPHQVKVSVPTGRPRSLTGPANFSFPFPRGLEVVMVPALTSLGALN